MIMCILNYLAIDRNNGGITQKIDGPRAGQPPSFIKIMENSSNEFYVEKADELKSARPMIVGTQVQGGFWECFT